MGNLLDTNYEQMTVLQQLECERGRARRARFKERQRAAKHDAAVARSELARWYRAKPMTWEHVAKVMGLKSKFTARTVAMRNPKK